MAREFHEIIMKERRPRGKPREKCINLLVWWEEEEKIGLKYKRSEVGGKVRVDPVKMKLVEYKFL